MRAALTTVIVFLGGFAIMVLEIVGARFLATTFGAAFYVWTSQIGVILVAMSLGYALGGAAADRLRRGAFLAALLVVAGAFTAAIPLFARRVLDAISLRHPPDVPIPALWQRLDPALGSAVIFLGPCFVLAMLSPAMIRLATRRVSHVGRTSGWIYAASTAGSIAGVFASGYVLIDWLPLSRIFQLTGALVAALGGLCLVLDLTDTESDHASP